LSHPIADLFLSVFSLSLYSPSLALRHAFRLVPFIPSSPFLLLLIGSIYSEFGNFPAALRWFARLYRKHPHTLAGRTVLSNIYFMLGDSSALCDLAASTTALAPNTVDAYFVAGNFHALRGEHERAIAAFSRCARALPPSCVTSVEGASASHVWTVLGHEYLEMKNSAAATHCYRKAIAMNEREYR
jgi:anaphase-promoting complex subunit 8